MNAHKILAEIRDLKITIQNQIKNSPELMSLGISPIDLSNIATSSILGDIDHLVTKPSRDQEIIHRLETGQSISETAAEFALSESRIKQIRARKKNKNKKKSTPDTLFR